MYPEHGRDATSLLRAADAALFRAKELGRNRHCVHDPSMLVTASNRFRVEQALRKAIEGGDFVLHYQPQVCLGRQRTIAVEALLRWRRSDNQIVAAGQFIEIAEQSGLMLDLNDWILETAAEAVSNWRRSGWPDARVAINVSAQQFMTGNFLRGHRAFARPARFAARSDRTRVDGDHAADRRRDCRGTAGTADAERGHRARRFRHRLFVADFHRAAAAQPGQARPQCDRRARQQSALGRDRALDHPPLPQPRTTGYDRGRGATRPTRLSSRPAARSRSRAS